LDSGDDTRESLVVPGAQRPAFLKSRLISSSCRHLSVETLTNVSFELFCFNVAAPLKLFGSLVDAVTVDGNSAPTEGGGEGT